MASKCQIRDWRNERNEFKELIPELEEREEALMAGESILKRDVREMEADIKALLVVSLPRLVRVTVVDEKRENFVFPGISLHLVTELEFSVSVYSWFATPPHTEKGVELTKKMLFLNARLDSLREGLVLLQKKLQNTRRLINVFKEIVLELTTMVNRGAEQLFQVETQRASNMKILKKKKAMVGYEA